MPILRASCDLDLGSRTQLYREPISTANAFCGCAPASPRQTLVQLPTDAWQMVIEKTCTFCFLSVNQNLIHPRFFKLLGTICKFFEREPRLCRTSITYASIFDTKVLVLVSEMEVVCEEGGRARST